MDFVVCTFSSNIGRLVYQLKAAQNLKHVDSKVISLDAKWFFWECVHWSLRKSMIMLCSYASSISRERMSNCAKIGQNIHNVCWIEERSIWSGMMCHEFEFWKRHWLNQLGGGTRIKNLWNRRDIPLFCWWNLIISSQLFPTTLNRTPAKFRPPQKY